MDIRPLVGLDGGGALPNSNCIQTYIIMAFTFKPNKRSRNADADSDSEDDDIDIWTAAGAWPRFLVVEADDPANPLSKISPFLMQKWFEGVSSSIKDIKRLGSGAFLVNCPTEKASKLLLGMVEYVWTGR